MKTQLNTSLSMNQWRKQQTWSTKSTSERRFQKTAEKVTSWGFTQVGDVRCMILSSNIRGLTIRSFRKYSSLMKLSKIMESWLILVKVMDQKSLWHMIWTCHRQRMNNTRKWVRIRTKAPHKTFQRMDKGRYNRHQTKREINRWDSREFLEACKTLLIKRLHSKTTAVFKTTTQIRVDRKLAWHIQPTPVPTRFKEVNRTKDPLWIKKMDRLWRTRPQKNLSSLNTTLPTSNSKKRCSSLVTTFWLNMLSAWWTSSRSWEMRHFFKNLGREPLKNSSRTMSGTRKTGERLRVQWQASYRDLKAGWTRCKRGEGD